MKESFDIPVVFFIFNRADTAKLVFEEIKKLRPKKLYIFADGPRPDRDELSKCLETRQITEVIDWECEVTKRFSDSNLGCCGNIASGLDFVFSKEEMAIILEDDCLPDPTFFMFTQELLVKYKNDHRIGAITGDNFQFGKLPLEESYYFSKYFNCWGWATWKRAWSTYDRDLTNWPTIKSQDILKNILPEAHKRYFWNDVLDRVYTKKLNTWDHQFSLNLFLNNMLVIVPKTNLIKNIGFDERATHTNTNSNNHLAALATNPIKFPLIHPKYIFVNNLADENTGRNCIYPSPLSTYFKITIKKILGQSFFDQLKKIKLFLMSK